MMSLVSQWFSPHLQWLFGCEGAPILSVSLHFLHQKPSDPAGPQWQHAEAAAAQDHNSIWLLNFVQQLMYIDNKKASPLKESPNGAV